MEVDIGIAREQRGQGYGAQALRLVCRSSFTTADAPLVVAYIKADNLPSIRAFENAGFGRQGMKRAKGHDAVVMSMRREQA